MSLPSPEKAELEKLPSTFKQASKYITESNETGALESLDKALKIITDGGKLSNGKGALYELEVFTINSMALLEFNRGNILKAAKYWGESFEAKYNGILSQYKIDEKNAKISDAISNGFSQSLAQSSARKSGQKVYTYETTSTRVPRPPIMEIGAPDKGVQRFPIQAEGYPFGNIVKLNNDNKSSCTATMVAKRIAISAAHCVLVEGVATNPSVFSLQKLGLKPSKSFTVEKYFTHNGENMGWDRQRKNDWVILITSMSDDRFGGFLRVSSKIPDEILIGSEKVMLPGYSSDLNGGYYLNLHYGCQFKPGQKKNSSVYITNCENAKGSSGAPLITTTRPYRIIGIHTAQFIQPKDEFNSIETFDDAFIKNLENVMISFGDSKSTIATPLSIQNLPLLKNIGTPSRVPYIN